MCDIEKIDRSWEARESKFVGSKRVGRTGGVDRSVGKNGRFGECLLCAVGGWQTRVRFLAAIKGLLRVSLASKHRQIRKFVVRPSFSKWIISISAKWPSGLSTCSPPSFLNFPTCPRYRQFSKGAKAATNEQPPFTFNSRLPTAPWKMYLAQQACRVQYFAWKLHASQGRSA